MSKKTNTNPAAEEKAPNPSAADQAEEVKKQEQPAADAEAEFLTDEYFDAWYGGICTALEKYAG
mgnify:FL=1